MLVMFLYPSAYMASLKGELPAPTLRILLSYLMYWEMMSLRLAQFWYQSNSVQFLDDVDFTLHSVFPKRSVCHNGCSFKNTC